VINQLMGKGKTGGFCTQIKSEVGKFELTVEGLGKLKFPILPKMSKALISEAKPAKFGKKDKTLYDPSVRNVWEIEANKIKIATPFWEQKLANVLQSVHKDLNMPAGSHLSAHLHNLLIYEKGQFFSPHQDTEKYDGMIATLVVLLPSKFSGGSLKIDLHGDKRAFAVDNDTRTNLTFIAFYADCHHEVTKVTAGYRVALTYNLVLKGVSKPLSNSPNDGLSKSIKDYFRPETPGTPSLHQASPRWLVYLFDHQYTQKSLNWNGLKGADRDSAAQFLAAAKQLGLVAHLALADVHESWSVEEDYDYNYGRSSQYWDDEDDQDYDDDETEESSDDPETMEGQELILQETTLAHWVNEDGKRCDFESKYVRDEMVCWSKANDAFKPTNTEYEGYMGNYGDTLDKWYHRGAIILWPKTTDILSRFELTPAAVLKSLSKQLKEDLAHGRENLMIIAPRLKCLKASDPKEARLIFDLALSSKDPQLAEEILLNFDMELISGKTLTKILPLIAAYGEDWFIDQLNRWSKKEHHYPKIITDLKTLVTDLNVKYKNISTWLLKYQRERMIHIDKNRQTLTRRVFLAGELDHMKMVSELLQAAVPHVELASGIIDDIAENQGIYSAVPTAHLCLKLREAGFPLKYRKTLETATMERLTQIISTKRPANNWTIKTISPCKCKDCTHLNEFLASSSLESYSWPLAKNRRQHIRTVLNDSGLPVTHVTLRQGSPQKLVLTKTANLIKMEQAEKIAATAAWNELKKNLQ
jgi:predicted 2-oxoglutarate/Fe(II)-dependent dioxygenase YbiX